MGRRVLKSKNNHLVDLLVANFQLLSLMNDKNVAKIALAMLYLGEGKKSGYCLSFANSNPKVISLYLKLLKKCYELEIDKLRVTIQCRADQNIEHLEKFWYAVTTIPKTQFYKSQIDWRTVGKPTVKIGYRGVCRVEYLSSYYFDDLMQSIAVLYVGP